MSAPEIETQNVGSTRAYRKKWRHVLQSKQIDSN